MMLQVLFFLCWSVALLVQGQVHRDLSPEDIYKKLQFPVKDGKIEIPVNSTTGQRLQTLFSTRNMSLPDADIYQLYSETPDYFKTWGEIGRDAPWALAQALNSKDQIKTMNKTQLSGHVAMLRRSAYSTWLNASAQWREHGPFPGYVDVKSYARSAVLANTTATLENLPFNSKVDNVTTPAADISNDVAMVVEADERAEKSWNDASLPDDIKIYTDEIKPQNDAVTAYLDGADAQQACDAADTAAQKAREAHDALESMDIDLRARSDLILRAVNNKHQDVGMYPRAEPPVPIGLGGVLPLFIAGAVILGIASGGLLKTTV